MLGKGNSKHSSHSTVRTNVPLACGDDINARDFFFLAHFKNSMYQRTKIILRLRTVPSHFFRAGMLLSLVMLDILFPARHCTSRPVLHVKVNAQHDFEGSRERLWLAS